MFLLLLVALGEGTLSKSDKKKKKKIKEVVPVSEVCECKQLPVFIIGGYSDSTCTYSNSYSARKRTGHRDCQIC